MRDGEMKRMKTMKEMKEIKEMKKMKDDVCHRERNSFILNSQFSILNLIVLPVS
jgi:hypothetical protein